MDTLRFGILGTASVNDYAFLPVIKKVRGAELAAVASRDMQKASRYARKHNIHRAYGNYDDLLADPGIHAVYVPLPVSMHTAWSLRAMDAGKHVLCEKPMAANRAQALAVAEKAEKMGLTFFEAYHYRYHPLAARIEDLVLGGDIGEVVEIRSAFGVPLMDRSKVQFDPACAGGALLDIGCYPVSFSCWLADSTDARVVSADMKLTDSGVDGETRAELEFHNGVRARIHGSLVSYVPMRARIKGSRGEIFVLTPFTPGVAVGPIVIDTYLLLVRRGMRVRSIRVKSRVSYQCQLEAFCECVRTGRMPITDAEYGAGVLKVMDQITVHARGAEPEGNNG